MRIGLHIKINSIVLPLALLICGFFVIFPNNAGATVLGDFYGAPPDFVPRYTFSKVLPVTWSAAVGDTVNFNVDKSYDWQGRTQLTATLKIVGAHSYFYVEDAYFNSLSAGDQSSFLASLQTLVTEFDNVIYPKEVEFFGTPWEPGIDNDLRITILISRLIDNAGGYFRTDDEYPRSQIASSNEREMMFVNATQVFNFSKVRNFLAHEFQHLISFYQKDKLRNSDDDVWLNEARSEYATTLVGYNNTWSGSYLQSRALSFLSKPTDSLTEWTNQTTDYATVILFAHYIADQYGASILSKSLQRAEGGIASINATLADLNQSDRFSDIVLNWGIANYINSPQTGERYAYKFPTLSASNFKVNAPTNSYSLSGSSNINVGLGTKDWAGSWINISGSGSKTLKLGFTPALSGDIYKNAVVLNRFGAYEVRKLNTAQEQREVLVDGLGSTVANVVFVPISQIKTINFTDNEPSRTYNLSLSLIEPSQSAISVSAVSPKIIYIDGGQTVTVTGVGFKSGLTVKVNGTPVNATFVNSSSFTFVAPKSINGNACLDITNNNGATVQNCTLLKYIFYSDGTLIRALGDTQVWIIKGSWRRHIVNPIIFTFYSHFGFSSVIDVEQAEVDAFKLSAWTRVVITQDSVTWRVYEVNGDATKHWITCADPDNCASTWLARGGNPDGIYTINQQEMNYYTEGAKVFLQ